MRLFVGVDLGSTTTKAVVLDEGRRVLGRGITNSRSNYDTASAVARSEALVNARFQLFREALSAGGALGGALDDFLAHVEGGFRLEQFLAQLDDLEAACREAASRFDPAVARCLDGVIAALRGEAPALFAPGARRKSDFFRDVAGARYLALSETAARSAGLPYESLVTLFDRSIIGVENNTYGHLAQRHIVAALDRALAAMPELASRDAAVRAPIQAALDAALEETYVVGTGYGRARLPFSKEHIRSEILCHGLGAHVMSPGTATVLDIGGQDTKAIQVDPRGIVESFQMNDRCAAGCGRYLGYIADEMNMGLHELGPMAMKSTKNIRINSTCTVFAGAELRDRLSLGDKREDIMAGLHRAIILRAMSILARSGGVRDQFTFTGGVAKNEAAVKSLKELVKENYGDVTLNIDPDSIYTGALGGATFAWRAVVEEGKTAESRQ